jgi:hypothetical protein
VVKQWYVHEALTHNPSADVTKLLERWGDGYIVQEPEHVVMRKESQNIC